ncbi:MAG: TetR/AcrR family transcriptional regulator [Myxococcota bacterium]
MGIGTELPAEGVPSSREKILDTAEAVFAARGFAGVGLREVAERVGLGKSSLFHHFPSKHALYVAVLERILQRIADRVHTAAGRSGPAPGRLQAWLHAVVDCLAEHPSYAPLLLRALFEAGVVEPQEQEHLDRILERTLRSVREILAGGIESGELHPVSISHTIQTLIGMTVYHFASGEFGEEVIGHPIYSAAEVRRQKQHIDQFCRRVLCRVPAQGGSRWTS